MSRKKTLPTIMKPFSHVHSTLTTLGFTAVAAREGTQYELSFREPGSARVYPFRIYTHTMENGQTLIDLNEADFISAGDIPAAARGSAGQLLGELQEYLVNGTGKKPGSSRSTPISEAMNGRMASNEEEVKKLGRSMAKYPTNSQLLEVGLIPDPIQ